MLIFCFPLVSAALVLYLKTATLGCVNDNVIAEVFCIFGKILLFLQSCRFCATSVSVGPVMSQCLFSSVPALSFICELDGFEHVDDSL